MTAVKLAARLTYGSLALGLVVSLAACAQSEADELRDKPMDTGIKKFDFDNATVHSRDGRDLKFTDGHHNLEGFEGKAGWDIKESPVFADVDGDNDLDAFVVYKWTPAAGSSSFDGYIWTWDGDKAQQVKHAVTPGNGGELSDATADKKSFTVKTHSRHYDRPTADSQREEETVTFGLRKGYPAQIEPQLGAVDRCVEQAGDPASKTVGDVIPRVAAADNAPAIGDKSDFTKVETAASIFNTQQWQLVRAQRTDGSTSCGWISGRSV